MNKEELQNEFNRLTSELKEMNSDDNRYGRIWNERAEIAGKINKLEKEEKELQTLGEDEIKEMKKLDAQDAQAEREKGENEANMNQGQQQEE